MAVEVFIRGASTETVHADENAAWANEGLPALADGGFNADADLLLAQNGAAIGLTLFEKELHRGHGDDAGGQAVFIEELLGGDGDLDLGARGEDHGLRFAGGGGDLIGAAR